MRLLLAAALGLSVGALVLVVMVFTVPTDTFDVEIGDE